MVPCCVKCGSQYARNIIMHGLYSLGMGLYTHWLQWPFDSLGIWMTLRLFPDRHLSDRRFTDRTYPDFNNNYDLNNNPNQGIRFYRKWLSLVPKQTTQCLVIGFPLKSKVCLESNGYCTICITTQRSEFFKYELGTGFKKHILIIYNNTE